MISFIIVSDDNKCLMEVNDIIISYMMKNNYEFNVTQLRSNDVYNFDNDDNKIYIIDNKSACLSPKEIRSTDWKSPIIILTKDINKVKTYRRLQILDIISMNEYLEMNLNELFDICLKQFNTKLSFKYKLGKNNYSLSYDSILYVYKDTVERKSILVTDTNEYKIPISLSGIHKLLPREFAYSHKSCIVNLNRIDVFDWCSFRVIFDNGKYVELLTKSHKEELIGKRK